METTRRNFVKTLSLGSAITLFPETLFSNSDANNDIQLVDYHVHLEKNFTIENVMSGFKDKSKKFGVVVHPGPRYSKMNDDNALLEYIDMYRPHNVFIGLQPVDPGWYKIFSQEAIGKLDYVLMDALEIPNEKGENERIWEPRFILNNKSTFMDRYLDFYVKVLENEKVNILANPTFLPVCLAPEYYKLWTEKRMETVIRYAVKNNVALEINSVYQYPKVPFIKMAKQAGAKFTIGSNGHSIAEIRNYDYCFEMIKECGLTNNDFMNFTMKK